MRGVVDEMEDMIDLIIFKQLETIRSTRYLSRREYRNRALDVFSLDLPKDSENRTDSNSVKYLGPQEFLRKYRMYPEEFNRLLDLVKDHPVFSPGSRGPKQDPREQILTLLHYLGQPGSSVATSRASHFIGYGTHYLFLDRAVDAICALREKVVF